MDKEQKLLIVLALTLVSGFLINWMNFEPSLYPYHDFEDPLFARTVNATALTMYIFLFSPLSIILSFVALMISLSAYQKDDFFSKLKRGQLNRILDALACILIATSVALLIIGIIKFVRFWQLNISFEGGCINSRSDNCLEGIYK